MTRHIFKKIWTPEIFLLGFPDPVWGSWAPVQAVASAVKRAVHWLVQLRPGGSHSSVMFLSVASVLPSPGAKLGFAWIKSIVSSFLLSGLLHPSLLADSRFVLRLPPQDHLVPSGLGVPGGVGSAHVENNQPAVCVSRGTAFSWRRFCLPECEGSC